MSRYTAEQAQEIFEDFGFEVRDDYSGRGMFGDRCPAIEGSLNDCLNAIANVAEDNGEFARFLAQNASFDSMGLDVVMYWPGLTYREKQNA